MLHSIQRTAILLSGARLTTSAMRCPHTQLSLRLGAAEIQDTAATLVSGLETAANKIESGNAQDALAVWTRATDAVAVGSAEVCLPALVATDAAARDAGAAAKRSIIDAFGNCYGRKALYDAIKASETSDALLARARDKHVARFEANGLALADASARDQVSKLKLELGQECAAMEQTINGDASTVALTRDELAGVPEAFVDALPTDGDKLVVSLKAPTLTPVLQHAKSSAARRKAYIAVTSRCPENAKRLSRFVGLRAQIAGLLGFASHAEGTLKGNMASTPAEVNAFLDRVITKLKSRRDEDYASLLALKQQEVPGATSLDPWDTSYFGRQIRASKGIDEEALKPHFPASEVVPAAVKTIGEDLFGFVVRGPLDDAQLWHEDCELYSVETAEGVVTGHVALDLKSRDGKFGHQMVVPLRPALVGGAPNVCAVLGNMGDADGRLRFREVETLLHELGHVFHALAGAPKPSILGWAWPMVPWPGGVEMDMLEVPSMLTQQFVYSPSVLEKIARPHADTGAPLPGATIEALAENRHLLAGLGNARYVAQCRYDLAMHSLTPGDDADACALWPPIYEATAGFTEAPSTHFASTWYHMCIGYDAGYYSYLWSEVNAVDAYLQFGDRLDADAGRRFRECVLEPGAAAGGAAMMEAFLGRPFREDAYFERLGVPV